MILYLPFELSSIQELQDNDLDLDFGDKHFAANVLTFSLNAKVKRRTSVVLNVLKS